MHEAVTAAWPTLGPVIEAVDPNTVLIPPLAVTDTGLLLLQIRGTPVSVRPILSVTVALSVIAVPLPRTKDR